MNATRKPARAAPPKPRKTGRPAATAPSGDQLREIVIAAAADVYAEHGFRDASVDKLIRAANISRPTFYRWFSDKREVIDILLARANAKLIHAIERAIANVETVEGVIEALIDTYLAWGTEQGGVVTALYREIHDKESPASPHREAAVASAVRAIEGRLVAMNRPLADHLFYEALVTMVEQVGSQAFAADKAVAPSVDRVRAIALRIFLASIHDDGASDTIPALSSVARAA